MDRRSTSLGHLAIGFIVCVVLPAVSYLDGSARLAYTMFADVREYRLDVRSYDRTGRARAISPTELARATTSTAAQFFYGAESFRRGTATRMPRALLGDIAALACAVGKGVSVDVTLYERARAEDPASATHVRRECSAP